MVRAVRPRLEWKIRRLDPAVHLPRGRRVSQLRRHRVLRGAPDGPQRPGQHVQDQGQDRHRSFPLFQLARGGERRVQSVPARRALLRQRT